MLSTTELLEQATDPEQYSRGRAASWIDDSDRQRQQRQQFGNALKRFLPKNCQSVLDIGCGSGWAAPLVLSAGVTHYIGLEPAQKNYSIARHSHPLLPIHQLGLADYESDEMFDCVLAIMVMSHLVDLDQTFSKISDFLKTGGRLIMITSTFHEGEDRYRRHGRNYLVNAIDDNQYVDRSIDGPYGIADINRRPEYYVKQADRHALRLMNQTKVGDIGYSPKDLLVFEKIGKAK